MVKLALSQLNSAYKPPTRKAIADSLFEESYDILQKKVNNIIAELPLLNIITDESTNINNARIVNISLHTPYGSFHYLSEDVGSTRSTAENTATWLHPHLEQLSNGDWNHINSVITDTCFTIFAM
jgi:hypothetical protein